MLQIAENHKMPITLQKSTNFGVAMKSRFLSSFLAFAMLVSPTAPLLVQPTAFASDLDAGGAQTDDGQFVRIGLNKSMVIRLPADAKDVLVGNPAIVDAVVRTKNTAYLFARSVGQTNIFFFDANGQEILNLDLEVALDMKALQKLLKRNLPGSRIVVDTVNNNVVLSGMAVNASEAKVAEDLATKFAGADSTVLNTIKIAGEDQVMLKVKIAEVQRDVLKQFGVDMQALLNVGNLALNLSSVNPFSNTPISPNTGFGVSSSKFDGVVRAMESDGMLRTLAEPNLTAVSGQPAKFHAGGEYPYSLCSVDNTGLRSCEISFKKYGVSLDFTPIVMSEGRINLKIHTEVSELSSIQTGDASIPSLNTRNADTTIELPNGGSMMLAGLIKDSVRQNINGTPGLKKLPVLGALFRSNDYVKNETEMVVIVTPYIVGSVTEKQLSMPTDNLNSATDRQTLLWGRLNKVYGTAGKSPDGTYNGDVGFIVE